MLKINWKQIEDGRNVATVDGTGIVLAAGQNDDGSFYWACGEEGNCSAPIASYKGIKNPNAYVSAAIDNCKAKAEHALAKMLAA